MSRHLHTLPLILASVAMSCTIAASRADTACPKNRKVVGGEDTTVAEHPWQVMLRIGGADGTLCGGSIVAQNWVLTAAHCFYSSSQPGDVTVKSGVTNYADEGDWIASKVERVVVHEAYNDGTQENDLALVKLQTPLSGSLVARAKRGLTLQPCELLEVTGWGRTAEGGTASKVLQKAAVPYINSETCNNPSAYNGRVSSGMLCAGYDDGGVDACQGDSGGPLVYYGPDGVVLVGVVSWGEGCARKLRYGIYTRVSEYGDWITKVIASGGQ